MSDEEIFKSFDFEKDTHTQSENGSETVAVEKPYELFLNDLKINTVLATPTDLKAFAYGYLVSEGVVKSIEQIESVKVEGNTIRCTAKIGENLEQELELRSSGSVGFRLNEEIGIPATESEFRIKPELVFNSLDHLNNELYRRTSGSHSASLIDENNEPIAKAIDVGRHTAFDKVIGNGLLKGIDFSRTFLLSSGRQSEGMVSKPARVGIPIIVSKAAPLSSGIKAAEEANITLICFADREKFKIFANSWRVKR